MHIRWETLDIENWERRDTFNGFKDFDFPYLVVGTEVEIGESLAFWKRTDMSPYLCMVYAVSRAANSVPAFRQRIRGNSVIQHERIHCDFTVPKGKESFTVKLVEYQPDFSKFYPEVTSSESPVFDSPGSGNETNDHWVFMSCLPWVHFTHMIQPIDRRSGSIPRVAWGRFVEKNDQVLLPISIQTHHGLVDGIHVAKFLEELQRLLHSPTQTFV